MKALVFTDLGIVKVLEVPEPVAGDGEVVIDVERAGICGSELHGISTPGFPRPAAHHGSRVRRAHRRRAPSGGQSPGVVRALRPVRGGPAPGLSHPRPRRRAPRGRLRPARRGPRRPPCTRSPTTSTGTARPSSSRSPTAYTPGTWPGHRPGCAWASSAAARSASRAWRSPATSGPAWSTARTWRPNAARSASSLGADAVGEALEGEFDVVFDAVGSARDARRLARAPRPGRLHVWLGLASPDPGFDAAHLVRFEKQVRGPSPTATTSSPPRSRWRATWTSRGPRPTRSTRARRSSPR